MNKINIKFSNIVGILLTIFVISIILYPWCKENIEKFDSTTTSNSSSSSSSSVATPSAATENSSSSSSVATPSAATENSSSSSSLPDVAASSGGSSSLPDVAASSGGSSSSSLPDVVASSGGGSSSSLPVVSDGLGSSSTIVNVQTVKPIDTSNYKPVDPPKSYLKSSEQLKTIYDTILNNRLEVNNYLNRIQLLRDNLHEKGTVSIDDYKKLINDINDAFTKKSKEKDLKGALEIKKALNDDKIKNIKDQIDVLNNTFSKLNTLSGNDSNNLVLNLNIINSIKTIETGINLNVKHLNSKDFNEKDYKPKIMIFLNNGCLTYKESENKYIAKHCEMTNKLQYFILQKITNGKDYLEHLTGDYYKQQELINKNSTSSLYPFNIIYPIDNIKKCVKVDLDGLSIEECKPTKINLDQRWLSSHINIKSCN